MPLPRVSPALAPVLALAACGEPGRLEPRPGAHVVLISLDTLRADHLRCYGYGRETSPRIDALAEQGVLFERCFAQSNNTGPSHMTMLTGVLPEVHKITHDLDSMASLGDGVPFLSETLAGRGYRTVAFADGAYVVEGLGFDRGFDFFDSRWEPFGRKLDRIEEWIGGASDEPTFLFVHTYGVHDPYIPDVEHDLFTDDGYRGVHRGRMGSMRRAKAAIGDSGASLNEMKVVQDAMWTGKEDFTDADVQFLIDLYDGCIHEVDAGVGRLLELLDGKGWLDDAWVIVTADHGEAFGEHGTFRHRGLYNEELHVPLIVRPPRGLDAAVRVDAPVGLVDLASTIAWAVDAPAASENQGVPLFPIDSLGERLLPATAGEGNRTRALVGLPWKLHVKWIRPKREETFEPYEDLQLYDLTRDWGEARDLAGVEATLATDLRAALYALDVDSARVFSRVGEPGAVGELSLAELEALGYLDGADEEDELSDGDEDEEDDASPEDADE